MVFFGIFLYIEFTNFFQYSELRLLMFMLMVLTLYGYARLQSICDTPGRRLKLLFYTSSGFIILYSNTNPAASVTKKYHDCSGYSGVNFTCI